MHLAQTDLIIVDPNALTHPSLNLGQHVWMELVSSIKCSKPTQDPRPHFGSAGPTSAILPAPKWGAFFLPSPGTGGEVPAGAPERNGRTEKVMAGSEERRVAEAQELTTLP